MNLNNDNLNNFSHNRDDHYKDIADDIFRCIEDFSNREELISFYQYFVNQYQLPQSVIKTKLCQHLANSYQLKKGKFHNSLLLWRLPLYFFYYGMLFYGIFFSKGRLKSPSKFDLIIDGINQPIEVNRFEKLLKIFGKNNVLLISQNADLTPNFPEYLFINKKPFRGIFFIDIVISIFKEFFLGVWISIIASIRVKANLLPISIRIIHDYLSYKTIFKSYSASYLIQERHYSTNPIKNYLFKKYGGLSSATIQKNIFQFDPIFYYMDIDLFLTLGTSGYENFLSYGGRIDKLEPVGSLFMEYYFCDLKQNSINEKYDLLILGINVSKAFDRLDSYSNFMSDYYSLFKWAAQLSLAYPDVKIGLIHHSNAKKDEIEDKILSGSNVVILDKNLNSYIAAFSSKYAITYGSTMGYELNAHGLKTYFIDPDYRCSFLPLKGQEHIDSLRITSFADFQSLVDKINNGKVFGEKLSYFDSSLWCLESSNVSGLIYKKLLSN